MCQFGKFRIKKPKAQRGPAYLAPKRTKQLRNIAHTGGSFKREGQ